MLLVTESILSKQVLILQGTTELMVYKVGILCRLWLAASNSNGIVIVGMYPCTQLAGVGCGCFRDHLWLDLLQVFVFLIQTVIHGITMNPQMGGDITVRDEIQPHILVKSHTVLM